MKSEYLASLNNLLKLEKGWDDFNAHPVRLDAYNSAAKFLSSDLFGSLSPGNVSISPLPSGGIEIECESEYSNIFILVTIE